MRAMLNPELRYFVTTRERWEDNVWHDYYKMLKKRGLTEDQIEDMDRIREVK